jgi:7-carboxy-7-deazaguanine synthase
MPRTTTTLPILEPPTPAVEPALGHRLRPLLGKPAGSLVVHEIYRSLQGESTFAGLPCVFIRLTACHLRCGYCDTPHAFGQGRAIALDDVVAEALALGDPLVEVTGGEPLLQPEVLPLLARLADAGRTVLLETSGSLDIAPVDARVRIILDLKTPGSGEVEANLWSNLDRLKPIDEVKFVLCDRDDFRWAVEVIRRHRLTERVPVIVGAAHGQVHATELAEWVLASGLPIRLQLQLHKILWEPDRRGV